MKPFRLSRRVLLRGAGAAIALPLLDAMLDDRGRLHGLAHAQPMGPPVCLVTWFFAHGTKMDAWTPAAEGPGWVAPPCLEALAPYRDDLLVLTGLANPAAELLTSAGGPHSRGSASWATGMPTTLTGAGGPTFERLAAAQLGGTTRLRALSVVNGPEAPGVESGSSAMLTNLSWEGASRPAPAVRDPAQLFARLFGGAAPAAVPRGSVLDHVRREIQSLQTRVGRDDRARLDDHLGAIRDMEREVTAAPSMCSPGVAPPGATLPAPERARLLLRLVVAALRCDLTRFASFALSNGMDNEPLPWLGLSDGHHDLSHADHHDTIVRITRDAMAQAAFFVGELAAARDAGGRLLDRCLVFISSEVSDGARHDYRNLPVVLAGRGGGVRPGAHLRFAARTSICGLYLALLRRAGVRVERFGLDGLAPLTLPG